MMQIKTTTGLRTMNVGIPKEIMQGEGRVALVPSSCKTLTAAGFRVFLQAGAGQAGGHNDDSYKRCGVEIVATAKKLYESADLIVKVKQPLGGDLKYLSSKHTLFGFLHLASQPELTRILCDLELTAIAFESVTDRSGNLPLLAPMSSIAGKVAVLTGASLLFQHHGGRGVLLGEAQGADKAKVVVLGAGIAGSAAVDSAMALGAEVVVFDLDQEKLAHLASNYNSKSLKTCIADDIAIAAEVKNADLVIGAVMVAGRLAPVVLKQVMIREMAQGSVIVDIAIDQGGCVENIRSTSYAEPVYTEYGVIHFAVPNMPGSVPRTSSQALSRAVLPYVLKLLTNGFAKPGDSVSLEKAVIIRAGRIIDPVLKQELGL